MNGIVIGKRIPLGGVVGGVVALLLWSWNVTHPETPIPGEVGAAISTAAVGLAQIVVVFVMKRRFEDRGVQRGAG